MPSGVASAARWKLSYMSAHPAGVFGLGAEPPPESTEPSRNVGMSEVVTGPRPPWVIWPTLSSSVIRGSRSLTRSAGLSDGSWYGNWTAAAGTVAVALCGPAAAIVRHRTAARPASQRRAVFIDAPRSVVHRRYG